MKYILRDETWFADVDEREIEDIAKGEFGIFAPTVTKKFTEKGHEYFSIDGIKVGHDGKSKRVMFNLNHYAPIIVKEDGEILVNFKLINNNLRACQNYIQFMDEKNIGRKIHGLTYKNHVINLYDYIKENIKHAGKLDFDSEPIEE